MIRRRRRERRRSRRGRRERRERNGIGEEVGGGEKARRKSRNVRTTRVGGRRG